MASPRMIEKGWHEKVMLPNTQSRQRPERRRYSKVHPGRTGGAKVLRFCLPLSSLQKQGHRMTPEVQQQSESPYCVKIETGSGQPTTVPIAFLTSKQLEVFLQTEFKRLAQEA